ncbi:MAG: hypothetical protein NT062_37580 [Proteobacteria bacterium]|nr:hypothetical protein [Pseudomonadota bacterium]
MAVMCKNCGGHFTQVELTQRRIPPHPWPLTRFGQTVATENLASGDVRACPECGCRTLRG